MRKEYVWTDESEIDEFLGRQEIGHLTTLDEDGWPQTVPVNYLWQGGGIFFHSGLRGKMEHLRRNPKVAFVVTEALSLLTSEITANPCQDTQLGRSVLIRGLAREIRAPEEKIMALGKIVAKYDSESVSDLHRGPRDPEWLANEPAFAGCSVVAIEVVRLTARQHLLGNKPDKYRKAVAAHFQKRGQDQGLERDIKTALLLNGALKVGGD